MRALSLMIPMLAASIALGRATDAWPLAGLVAALSVLLALLGERWEVDRGRQLVTSAVGAGVGYAAATVLYQLQPGYLAEGWARIGAAALLAAAARFVLDKPIGGRAATLAISFAGVLAIGETRPRGGYPALAATFLLAGLWSLREVDLDRPAVGRAGWRPLSMSAGVVILAAALGVSGTLGMRRLHAYLMGRVQSSSFFWKPKTGFSDRMELGSLDGLLDSDTLVLRVRGPHVDYLRGAAYDIYEAGRWVRSDVAERETSESWTSVPAAEGLVEIEAISERTDRFFLPLAMRDPLASPAALHTDALGIVKRDGKLGTAVVRFNRGPREHAIPMPPTGYDLGLANRVRSAILPLAQSWTAGMTTPSAQLDALERHLSSDYRYSRTFQRSLAMDPALEFLLRDKSGQCEYFATGLVLMARSLRIPARLVTGFRVAERSSFGSYEVVRERNAHAWVEAWIDGQGWTTRDPTPPDLLPQDQPHDAGYLSSAIDIVRIGVDELLTWLGHRTIGQTTIASALGLLILGYIIARGARRNREPTRIILGDEQALPFLESLLRALENAGHARANEEPLERLAARLPASRAHAGELLLRYADLRYGGVGDATELASALDEEAARLAKQPS